MLWSALGALAALAAGPARAGPARLVVDARAVASLGDGTDERPFKTLGAALEAARDGDAVLVRAGLYVERVRLSKRVFVSGPRLAVLVAPDAASEVVVVEREASLAGLSVQGGAVGVVVRAPAVLAGLSFSAQRSAAVLAEGARARIDGGRFEASFDLPALVGVDGDRAPLEIRDALFDGPFRFAIRGRGGSLSVDSVRVEGARVAVACVEGCDGRLARSVLVQGRGAGLVIGGSRMRAQDNVISRFEECIAINAGSEAVLEDNATAFCEVAGVAATEARLTLGHHVHVGPTRVAAIQATGGSLLVGHAVIIDPGSVGIGLKGGEAELFDVVVRSARADPDGLFGDGLFALSPARLSVSDSSFEDSGGIGASIVGGQATISGTDVRESGGAGVAALSGARVELEGVAVAGGGGAGLLAAEGASIDARLGLISSEVGRAADCDSGAAIRLSAMRLAARHAMPGDCVSVVRPRVGTRDSSSSQP